MKRIILILCCTCILISQVTEARKDQQITAYLQQNSNSLHHRKFLLQLSANLAESGYDCKGAPNWGYLQVESSDECEDTSVNSKLLISIHNASTKPKFILLQTITFDKSDSPPLIESWVYNGPLTTEPSVENFHIARNGTISEFLQSLWIFFNRRPSNPQGSLIKSTTTSFSHKDFMENLFFNCKRYFYEPQPLNNQQGFKFESNHQCNGGHVKELLEITLLTEDRKSGINVHRRGDYTPTDGGNSQNLYIDEETYKGPLTLVPTEDYEMPEKKKFATLYNSFLAFFYRNDKQST